MIQEFPPFIFVTALKIIRETTTRRLLFEKCSEIVNTQHALNFSLLAYLSIYNLCLQIVGPACYKRATQICYCKEGFFMVLKNVPCAQKIFVLLTSQS